MARSVREQMVDSAVILLAKHGLDGTSFSEVLADRTWVLITEAPDGGWGLAGHANTNAELIAAARAQIAELSAAPVQGARG